MGKKTSSSRSTTGFSLVFDGWRDTRRTTCLADVVPVASAEADPAAAVKTANAAPAAVPARNHAPVQEEAVAAAAHARATLAVVGVTASAPHAPWSNSGRLGHPSSPRIGSFIPKNNEIVYSLCNLELPGGINNGNGNELRRVITREILICLFLYIPYEIVLFKLICHFGKQKDYLVSCSNEFYWISCLFSLHKEIIL